EKHRLVVFCNPLHADDPEDTITDGACAWLVAPTAVTESSKGIFRVYRALGSEGETIKQDLENLIRYQDGMDCPEGILFSNLTDRPVINEITYQCNQALRKNMSDGEVQQYYAQLIIGQQGVGNIWMSIIIAYLKNA
ncbi:hypothetical protein, partial [Serratia marcescens]|uniref:hypothetical protein n=1 Tax=Serratia marcescens TaxID=615 RepID=UPI001652FB81